MIKYIFNPFFIYSSIFVFIILIYPLQWSDIQPELSGNLTLFILSTVVISFFLSLIFRGNFKNISLESIKYKNNFVWIFSVVGVALEFIYAKGIPLIKVMKGEFHDYFAFGIPTFHAIFLPYLISIGLISFYNYLASKNKSDLFLYLFSILFCVLIINRGAVIFILFSSLVIHFLLKNNLTPKKVILTVIGGVITLYLFGVVGNYRMVSSGYQGNDIILTVGRANSNFYESNVPTEFFWSYLYLVTPFSNLQYQVNNIPSNVDIENAFKYHILIDFLQKRIFPDNQQQAMLLQEEFNVSTMYGDVVQVAGIPGAMVLFIWYILVVFVVTKLTPSKYKIIVIGILCCISVLQCFTNIMVVAGYGLPPVLIALLSRFKFANNRII